MDSPRMGRPGISVRSIDSDGEVRLHRSIRQAAKYHRVNATHLGKKLRNSSSAWYDGHKVRFEIVQNSELPSSLPSLDEAAALLSSFLQSIRIPETLEMHETEIHEGPSDLSLEFDSLLGDPIDIPIIPLKSEIQEEVTESEEEEPFSVWLDSPIGSDVD